MRLARLACSSLVAALALTALVPVAGAERVDTKVVLISWDGAADWVVDRLLAEGKLPSLARLARRGARAAYSTPAFPSKTASGHAAIWTGAYSDVNGVSGNSVPLLPRSEHTLLERRSGFDSASLLAEPLWITALKHGKRVAVLSATQAYPEDRDLATLREAGVPLDRFVSFSGFEHSIDPARVLTEKELAPAAAAWSGVPRSSRPTREAAFRVGDDDFFALVLDDPDDPIFGYDTVVVRQASRDAERATASATLKPRAAAETTEHYSGRFRVTKGDLFGFTYFRLFELAPDGGRMTLYRRGVNGLRGAASQETVESYLDAYGGFHDEVFYTIYSRGELGAPLYRGGDGAAERRLLEIVRFDVARLIQGTKYALTTWRPDLLIHYAPMTDSAGHVWVGALDPESPRYDAAIADRLWPFYAEVFRLQDAWLGAVLDAVDEKTVVAVVSDHGMAGTATRFVPNAVLAQAGLVAVEAGQIDLTRTKACVPPSSDFFVTVNGIDRKGGIVPHEQRAAVLAAAERALLDARDPQTGAPIVTAVLSAERLDGLGMGGPAGGDLYIELAPGYYPIGDVGTEITRPDSSPIGSGSHGFLPLRRSMQAIFFVGGGPVPHGLEIPGVRQIDIAPTLARLLGIPSPRDARGHAIGAIVSPIGERGGGSLTRSH